MAASRVYLKYPLDPRWMLQLLTDIEHTWTSTTLTREEEMWLAESFTAMLGNLNPTFFQDDVTILGFYTFREMAFTIETSQTIVSGLTHAILDKT